VKKAICLLLLLMIPVVGRAEPNRAFLKNGQIRVQTNAEIRDLDYSQDKKYTPSFDLERWAVLEKSDPVQEALKVYEKKSRPLFTRRFWIIDKNDQTRKVVVEYTSHDRQQQIIFSPDEKYVYYVKDPLDGPGLLTGVNLLTGKPFVITPAHSFFLSTCPDQKSYVVVKGVSSADGNRYMVYTQDGKLTNTVVYQGAPGTISQAICQ